MGILPVCCMPRSASTPCFLPTSNYSGVVMTSTLGPTRRVQVFERSQSTTRLVSRSVLHEEPARDHAPCLFFFKPRKVDAQLCHPITRRVLDKLYLLVIFVQDLNVNAKALQFFHQHLERLGHPRLHDVFAL